VIQERIVRMQLRRLSLTLIFCAAMWPAVGRAQDRKPDSGNGNRAGNSSTGIFSGSPLFWRTDWVLEAYVGQITRYYNLNKEQEEYTRKLLNQRVKSFLQDHERDVRALMAEYMEYQLSQELPDPKAAQEFAKKAAPLARDIRKEIFEGNMRWREVLDDQQRAKHDQDLRQMTSFFDNLEQGLDRWKDGKVQPSDLPGRVGRGGMSSGKIEDSWDIWVRSFVQSYKLDEGQKQTAMSILRELKEEATRYRDSNKEKFTEVDASAKAVRERSPKTDPQELAKYQAETLQIKKRRDELERPIAALFDQLRTRVEAIPTVEQRKARQSEIDRLRAFARRPTSQPADTQPATTTNVASNSAAGG
jgi:hypothetical protein